MDERSQSYRMYSHALLKLVCHPNTSCHWPKTVLQKPSPELCQHSSILYQWKIPLNEQMTVDFSESSFCGFCFSLCTALQKTINEDDGIASDREREGEREEGGKTKQHLKKEIKWLHATNVSLYNESNFSSLSACIISKMNQPSGRKVANTLGTYTELKLSKSFPRLNREK